MSSRGPSDPPVPGQLGTTWPLFTEHPNPSFPENARALVTPFRPPTGHLEALERRAELPPEGSEQYERELNALRASQPPVVPDWMRAARAMIAWLEERVQRGSVDALDEAAIARTWVAFSLGGAVTAHVMRVAHLVSRAHHAIRDSRRVTRDVQAAIRDCAGVLHAGLPLAIRERMPIERTVLVVRRLHEEQDNWAAVVEGTAELLGWKDYARIHAASVIRLVIEHSR
ncbi:MAG TPA: hypothetical protein VFQ61_37785 [Polyangiaceae bacterium]|nr:hypothetical protein [Polyangiaceae bacterium]